jgi:hypothetical protein
MKPSRRLPLILGICAVVVGMAPAPTQGGSGAGCTQDVSVNVPGASTPGVPVRVDTSAGVHCPTPESQGGFFGPPSPQTYSLPPVGSSCRQVLAARLEFGPGSDTLVFWIDPSRFVGLQSGTPEAQDPSRFLGGSMSAKDFFMQGGSIDYWVPYTLTGIIQPNGTCGPKDPKDPAASYTANCTFAPGSWPGCLIPSANGPVGPAGGLPLTALPVNLQGMMRQMIAPGQISTLPQDPAPGLVNTGTCFFVNGLSIQGQDAGPGQTFQLVLTDPPDASGRSIYYVFQLQMHLDPVQPFIWNFGDGSTAVDGKLPAPCWQQAGTPLTKAFSHTYNHFSPQGGFAVTATENFVINATEYFSDAAGTHGPINLGALPPLQISPAPQPFVKAIVQEEGVPVT